MTRQQVRREGYLEEFLRVWSQKDEVRQFYISLYTPQIGEVSDECLTPADREQVVADLLRLRTQFQKMKKMMPEGLIHAYARPPESPDDCVFAKTTTCLSADLEKLITPCQLGGNPNCSRCGCIASAALKAVARHKLPLGLRVGAIFDSSLWIGARVRRLTGGAASAR